MRSITINDAILNIITDDMDKELISSTGQDVWTEEEVRENLSESTYNALFGSQPHAVAEILVEDPSDTTNNDIDQQENIMTENTENNTTSIMCAGTEYEPQYKCDQAFAGQVITGDDFDNLSKPVLVEIAKDMWNKLQTQHDQEVNNDIARVEKAQETAKQIEEQRQPKAVLNSAYNAQLSSAQKTWLQDQDRFRGVRVEDMGNGRFKIRFVAFTIHAETVLAGVFRAACEANNWYCKVQLSGKAIRHIYINMHL